jgi:Putative auto-transporter adhesin, head GIN domain
MTTTPTAPPDRRPRRPVRGIGLAVLVLLAVLLVVTAGVVIARSGQNSGTGSGPTVNGSGTAATELRHLPSFTAVELAGTNSVSISVGAEQSVRVRADDNLIGLVTTEVRGGRLVIDETGSFRADEPMSVSVTMPTLDTLSLSGTGTLTADGVRSAQLTVSLDGTGSIRSTGTTDQLRATIGGTGELRLNDLVASRATAAVAGSGSIQLFASEALDATISGTGAITYRGSPGQVTKNVTGTGTVIGQ